MRYVMKQKFWSWGDDFMIRDERGQDVFRVDGRAFSWGDKLSFQDLQGRELAFIRQKLLSWGPTYEIESNGQLLAVVQKHLFTFFRCRFTIDVPGPNDLEATGNFSDHQYAFERGGQIVASVSKEWFKMTDTYGVEITGGDDVLILASAVVIDMVCHQESKQG
ncbi:MAG: LURP-one-related family protein [Opitutus sp.]